MNHPYTVAAYVWPSYTGDEPRSRQFWPEGMGEWQSVRSAEAKYPGHAWPRKPLWGYVNEADPFVMEMEIAAATTHGVNAFIYDWYWYDGRPFLEQCLVDGFLRARNNREMSFCLMWANHDATTLWDKRLSCQPESVIWRGSVSREVFEPMARRMIEKFFTLPNYLTIDGKPVFMIYDAANLVKGFGGVEQAREALDWFRQQAVAAGLVGLHLQMCLWNEGAVNVSGVDGGKTVSPYELISSLGFDSVTHYQFCHFTDMDRPYQDILTDVQAEWKRIDSRCPVPYFPHVSVGWDNNPRFLDFRPGVTTGNTPEAVGQALELAKNYVDSHPLPCKLITVNSWNEWTESSYLQPDNLNGYGYLAAVKNVFRS